MSYLLTAQERGQITGAIKESARAASTANLDLGVAPGSVDGVSLSTGDRVLVKDQTTTAENGLYEVDSGGLLQRAEDAVDGKVSAGLVVAVEEGTANGDTLWKLTTNNPITVGTTALTFALQGDGTGDVDGPASSTDGQIALFDGTTGKLLKHVTGVSVNGSGVVSTPGKFDIQGGTTLLFDGSEVTDCLDEDTLASDSAVALVTQQSVKAYVDNNTSFRDQLFVETAEEVSGSESTKFLAKFPLLPSEWEPGTAKQFYFGATLAVSDVALTGEVELYNLTDGELVTLTGGTLTTSSTGFVKLESGALTVGSAAGNLQDTEKIYEVRIKNDGTLSSEKTFLGSAWIRIS